MSVVDIETIMRSQVLDSALPVSLRPVAPFIEEAQAILRNKPDIHKGHVCIYCIDHGFELVEKFDLQLGILEVISICIYSGFA